MALLRLVMSIPHDSALPKDATSNRILVGTGSPADPSEAERIAIAQVWHDFFTDATGTGNAVQDFLSRVLDGANARIKIYNLGHPKPRVPIYDEAAPLVIPDAAPFPSEIAICCSYQAARVAGVPQERRRGRFFVGPLAVSSSAGTVPPRVGTNCRDTLVAAMSRMFIAFQELPAIGAQWMVMSGLDAPEAPPTAPVNNGWVDNAYDVQRRRGEDATGRATWQAA